MRSWRVLVLLAVLMSMLMVMGCGGATPEPEEPGDEEPTGEEEPEDEEPAEGETKTGGELVIARPSDAISLDSMLDTTAVGAWVYVNMLEPLIRLNYDMEIEGVLAEDWEMVDDTTVRFYLKEGVKFHDGEPFNADAVVFNFERFLESEPPARWKPLAGPLAGAEKVDEYTVDVSTEEPYGPMLRALAMPYVHMVSPKAVEELGEDFGRSPVGTGPFKFVEWKTDDRIVIEKNEDYWGEQPNLDRVVFRVMPEESARMLALRSGDVDMVLKPAPAEIEEIRANPDFNVYEETGLRVIYLLFGTQEPPADDWRVRRAVAHAVDVDAIVEHILEGGATKANGYIAEDVFGFADMNLDEKYRYDPDLAEEMLAEAGYTEKDNDGYLLKDGERLKFEMLGFRGRFLKDGEIIEAIQEELRNVGVEVEVEWLEWAAAFDRMRAGEISNCTMTGWVTTNADADYTLYNLFHSDEWAPEGWNRARFSAPEVDELLDKARRSVDQDERLELYRQVQEILTDETVLVPIYKTVETAVTRAEVKGMRMHPVEYNLFVDDVWLDE